MTLWRYVVFGSMIGALTAGLITYVKITQEVNASGCMPSSCGDVFGPPAIIWGLLASIPGTVLGLLSGLVCGIVIQSLRRNRASKKFLFIGSQQTMQTEEVWPPPPIRIAEEESIKPDGRPSSLLMLCIFGTGIMLSAMAGALCNAIDAAI